MLFATIALFGYYAVTLGFALNNQSYGSSMTARAAEWGRSHGLSFIVNWAEAEAYKLNPPKVGGTPTKSQFGSGPTSVKLPSTGHLPAPKDIKSPALNPLPGEGVWHVVGRTTANGIPGFAAGTSNASHLAAARHQQRDAAPGRVGDCLPELDLDEVRPAQVQRAELHKGRVDAPGDGSVQRRERQGLQGSRPWARLRPSFPSTS